jgi:3',5'-cyclic AMP phosphodiesterase CpdA
MDVPRDQVVAFALYTVERGMLKLTAQLYPLKPGEPREARLECEIDGQWVEKARAPVIYPGWSAHFRLAEWDQSVNTPYRIRHGESAAFTGIIRRDPADQPEITVASLSCNSSRTTGPRPEIVDRLRAQNPDLLFFAGDQTYRHTEHTAGWIEFGLQFRDILRDRPTVTIPDDHDVGHPNLWGENGRRSLHPAGADGGYFFPAAYVNLVQRQQTWHLPDPADPAAVGQGITVYFTRLRVGGIDFAILEDRKFKSGPKDKIPQRGPRPDHINDPAWDPASIDLPGLSLLGDRQHRFLKAWTDDWEDAQSKCVLSQTAFCGAVHLHGRPSERLLADLDCNGWPQAQRNRALADLRRAGAVHLCGDQHLAVLVRHGIETWGDGPFAFTSPALVNTIYGRWWEPADHKPGPHPVPGSPLPWTGDYRDGLGNRLSMIAYANPGDVSDEQQRADGYGLARFHKISRTITFECWPRFGDQQFPGWPHTVPMNADGRIVTAFLPEITVEGANSAVIKVSDHASGDVLYCRRIPARGFRPPVFSDSSFTIRIGRDRPDAATFPQIRPQPAGSPGRIAVKL